MTQETHASITNGKLTVDQILQQAIAQHQAGRLQEAEELYRVILQSRPNHPEANHNMGVLAVQMCQPAAGLPYFMKALDADPACAQYWLSGIDALFQADQLDAAREVLAIALQQGLQGDEVDALAVRLNGGGNVAEQANAEYQHTSRESQPGSSPPSQDSTKSPNPQEINALVALFTEGRYPEAVILAQTLTERFPLHGFGWKVLGALFKLMGRNTDALEAMQKAAALLPDDAEAHNNLGVTLKSMGRPNEAESCYRRALEIDPNDAEAHYNLGGILQSQDRLDEAELSYRRALQLKPDFAETHNNLGIVLHDLGRTDEAAVSYRAALEINPDYTEAQCNLGKTLKKLGRLDEAEICYRRALEINPDYVQAHNNLGNALMDMDKLDEAEASFRRALQIKPDYVEAHSNLGCTLQGLNRQDEAEICFRQALQINPDYAPAYLNLGVVMHNYGQLDAAAAYFRRALAIKPDYVVAHSNLIFTLDFMVDDDIASLLEERKRWDATYAAPLHQQRMHYNIADPERRIRIGYVSADFREHSAPKAFGAMLTRYDRAQFEVFAYSNLTGKSDALTELFKQSVTVWRNIANISDDAAAQMIRVDRIDVLVDLSGHSAGNRLLVFARKPAPIQITAWGYAAGTGMQAMDVFFNDPVMIPTEDKQYFAEEIRYLPSVVGAFFIDPFPDVNKLSALSNGFLIFGSLNRLAKVSEETYRAWGQILLAVPGSRLILKTVELDNVSTQERVLGYFTQAGVAANRIIMQGKTSWYEHMQAYHRIDIALDPFSQSGGVTVLEGLMMGVPVINLRGATLAGRLSASIMTTLGLTDWIATSREQYVELAIRKAADLQSLAVLRQQLRGIFSSSVLGDQAAYALAVEQEYRKLWQEWCSLV